MKLFLWCYSRQQPALGAWEFSLFQNFRMYIFSFPKVNKEPRWKITLRLRGVFKKNPALEVSCRETFAGCAVAGMQFGHGSASVSWGWAQSLSVPPGHPLQPSLLFLPQCSLDFPPQQRCLSMAAGTRTVLSPPLNFWILLFIVNLWLVHSAARWGAKKTYFCTGFWSFCCFPLQTDLR